MTERHPSNPPQIATPVTTGPDFHFLHPSESVDEEPYEIKCICDFKDDDGNTIFCEQCDTWQHIECYYHGNAEDASKEEFHHACADCSPRPFDRALATERQRKQRQLQETPEGADKKSKRRVDKSHKKKSRPADLQTNGWHAEHDGASGRKGHISLDHVPPPKKVKSHHKSANSISSHVGKRSPSIGTLNARNHGRPPSPSRSPPDLPPGIEVHSYSPEFLRLYDDDPGDKPLPANAFSSLTVTNSMSSWLHDPVKLEMDTGIQNTEGVFQKILPASNDKFFEKLARESLLVQDRWEHSSTSGKLHWRYLTTAEPRQPLSILGELKGTVGFQSDYYKDAKNQYTVLAHPQPFVFFHPDLPIYIDTRSEGSKCRYIRRSCKANVTLDTYIVNQSEYHFCIVNEEPLTAGAQLTLPWDIHSQNKARWTYLLGLSEEQEAMTDEPEMSDIEYQEISKWLHDVLSTYGGCACDLGKDCAFARFHRERHGRMQVLQSHANGVKKRVGRPPKPKQHVSPTTAGHATTSRAASESRQDQHDDNDQDSRSNSGSHRSKGRSRELSPRSVGDENNEPFFGIGEALSMRDKRKIAQLEEYSRRQSQSAEVKQPPLKKKRTSGGSSASASAPAAPKERAKSKVPKTPVSTEPTNATNHGGRKIHYADAGTSRPMSASPMGLSPTDPIPLPSRKTSCQISVRSRHASATARAPYCDVATQTDPVQNAWYSPASQAPKRKQIPLAKRLISFRHNSRKEADLRTKAGTPSIGHTPSIDQTPFLLNGVSSPKIPHAQPPTPTAEKIPSVSSIAAPAERSLAQDVQMIDAPPSVIPNTIKPPPPPWPTAAPASQRPDPGPRPPDLKLLLPSTADRFLPQPATNSASITGSATPSSAAAGPAMLSPKLPTPLTNSGISPSVPSSGNTVAPSPIKKKLSLSDYSARFSRRASAVPDHAEKGKDNKKATALSAGGPAVAPAPPRSDASMPVTKLPNIIEDRALVQTPAAEKEGAGDPMTGVEFTSRSFSTNGATTQ